MVKYKKIQLFALVLGLIGIFMIFTGSSYAFFTSRVTSKDYVITTGNLQLDFLKTNNEINLTNTYPLTNTEGLATDGYSFTITNNGSISTKYQLRLELDSNNTIPIEYIKLAYVKTKENSVNTNNSLSEPVLVSNLNATQTFIKDQVIEPSKTDGYTLKLWIDYSAPNDIQGKTFKAKIVIDALQNVEDGYVFNSTKPIITLNKDSKGNTDISLVKGEAFTDPGVLVIKDDKDLLTEEDLNITYEYTGDGTNLETVNEIDTNTVGVYYINYTVTDSDSNIGKSIRVVTVNNTRTKPEITLNGEQEIEISQYEAYVEQGATSTAKVAIIGNVDNTKIGNINSIKYIAIDNNGSVNSIVRTVTIKKPVFSTDSWETIVANIRAGNGDVYAPVTGGKDAQSVKEVEIITPFSYDKDAKEYVKQKHQLRVINTTPCTNGETSETACGFVVEFADLLYASSIAYKAGSNDGGFTYSALSNFADDMTEFFIEEPDLEVPEFYKYLINTKVIGSHSKWDTNPEGLPIDENGNHVAENQKFYFLDKMEVFGISDNDSAANTTRQLDYYLLNNTDQDRIKILLPENKKQTSSNGIDFDVAYQWWLRSVPYDIGNVFDIVTEQGKYDTYTPNWSSYISPAFRIG